MAYSPRIEELRRRVLRDPASGHGTPWTIAPVESAPDDGTAASTTLVEMAGHHADRALFGLESWLAAILAARARRHAGKSRA